MKKQLLLLALMLGSQISAQTVKDVLDELNGSAQEYFEIVNTTTVPEFQERNRRKLNTLLSQDISTVTLDQMEAIKRAIDSVFNTMNASIKNVSPEDFSDLSENTKEELQEVIEGAIQQAELQRLENESAELQKLEEAMAQQKRLVEAALLTQTIAAPTLSIDMMDAEGSTTTDPIANPLPTTDRLAQLAEELSGLDETSSSDANTVLLNDGGILEDFMNERMANLNTNTQQEYQDALGLFLKNKGIKIDDTILPELATRLFKLQEMPYYNQEELDEEDMDTLLAQLTPEEVDELAQEINKKDNQQKRNDSIAKYLLNADIFLVRLEQLASKRTKERELRLLSILEKKRKYYSDLFGSLDFTKTKPHPIIQMISARKPQADQSLSTDSSTNIEDVD